MKPQVAISEAESAVMEVLWASSPRSADDICRALAGDHGWQPATVKTLLNRLLKKGAIRAEAEGRRFLYSPALRRDDWVLATSKGLLDRLFDGRVAPLVAHFSRHRKLGKRDLEELKRLIREMEQ